MALRIRFQFDPLASLGYSIERLSDGLFFDFEGSTFGPKPVRLIAPLPGDVAPFVGRFKATLDPTPAAQFTDGDYVVTVHDLGRSDEVVAELACTMHDGDDATVFPTLAIGGLAFDVPAFTVAVRTSAGQVVQPAKP